METKDTIFTEGESHFLIQFPSGHYLGDIYVHGFIETRHLNLADKMVDLGVVKKKMEEIRRISEEQIKVKKITCIAVSEFGEKIPAHIVGNGIEAERKYVVANLGDYSHHRENRYSTPIPAYVFYSGMGKEIDGWGCSILNGNLYTLSSAEKVAEVLTKQELVENSRRVIWSVIEVVFVHEEIKI